MRMPRTNPEVAQLRRLLRIVEDRERTATARLAAEQLKCAAEVERRRKVEAHRDRLLDKVSELRAQNGELHEKWVRDAPADEPTLRILEREKSADARA